MMDARMTQRRVGRRAAARGAIDQPELMRLR
jgi:hypothetical protein